MRGRPNDPTAARAKARRHAERSHTCECGRVCWGNGGWASHKRACATFQRNEMDRCSALADDYQTGKHPELVRSWRDRAEAARARLVELESK